MGSTITEAELLTQPERWRRILDRSGDFDLRRTLRLRDFEEIVLFGSGTSYYLALACGEFIEQRLGVKTRVLPSCDVLLFGDRYLGDGARRLAIGFSRSGESTEGVLAARALLARGIDLLSVGCVAGSALVALGRHRILVPEGDEDGFVMMRSFTSMFLAVQLATLFEAGAGPAELAPLPLLAERVLAARPLVETATNGRDFSHFVFLGSGPDHPIALESAMKLQESAGVVTEAYRTLEYRHGPRATGGAETFAVLFAPDALPWGVDLLRDLRDQGLGTMVIGEDVSAYAGVVDAALPLRSGLPADLRSVLLMLPVHLMALAASLRRGRDPDRPENLAKVVLFGTAGA